MAKQADRLKALQQRAAALAVAPPATEATEPVGDAAAVAATRTHFGGALDDLYKRTMQALPVAQVAPDLRPEMRQPRLLPLPAELRQAASTRYAELVTELEALGESLRQHQIQPIVVYPGTSTEFPAARFLILIGHRRWTAATLVGLEHLDAIIVEQPSPTERVLLQYTENEAREEFSDMERAWALQQMKTALGDAPWETVEAQLHMSRARRQQLLRLTAFTPEQQQAIARLRLQETQMRSLHTAVRAQELSTTQADTVLARLGDIAIERTAALLAEQGDHDAPTITPRRQGIDGPTVARLVARAQRTTSDAPERNPRWLTMLHGDLAQLRQRLQRSTKRIAGIDPAAQAALHSELAALQAEVQHLVVLLHDADEEG